MRGCSDEIAALKMVVGQAFCNVGLTAAEASVAVKLPSILRMLAPFAGPHVAESPRNFDVMKPTQTPPVCAPVRVSISRDAVSIAAVIQELLERHSHLHFLNRCGDQRPGSVPNFSRQTPTSRETKS